MNDVPGNPSIGHDLYSADSMPPWAQRTNKWGRPQTLSVTLLRKVLARNYYAVSRGVQGRGERGKERARPGRDGAARGAKGRWWRQVKARQGRWVQRGQCQGGEGCA